DAHLIAVSAATGALQWETTVADDPKHYAISAAPLAYHDLVVTGVATPDAIPGGRGFIVAYDANSGKERWRFATIPAPGEPGNETWVGNSWREGGGPTWLTGSYDPELDLLIWGVGNPKPVFDRAARKGDNLYTNSAVALRGSAGGRPRLGREPDSRARGSPDAAGHREAGALGESQRLLLRPGSRIRHVSHRSAVRASDLDRWPRSRRTSQAPVRFIPNARRVCPLPGQRRGD